MPRNRGTSRKGKPGKNERASGMGRALQRAQGQRHRGKRDGMAMQAGVESIGMEEEVRHTTKSVLEMNSLDDFLMQADMANREFVSEKEGLVVLDSSGQAYRPYTVKWADQKTNFVFSELSVPRRPAWDDDTTPEELQRKEQEAFLEWRRGVAAREEELVRNSSSAAVTPFEKNLEVWRQLWRVLERSSCLLQLVDARNPLFYLSKDLRAYAESLGKPMMVLVNKSDYLSAQQRQTWCDYLTEHGWDPVFFSAVKEQHKLDVAAQQKRKEERQQDPRLNELDDTNDDKEISDYGDDSDAEEENEEETRKYPVEPETDDKGVKVPQSREQLLETMMAFARAHNCQPDERYGNRIQFGMVGSPNVGKSSVINVLVGSSKHTHGVVRVGVASQPGKTKHFQTLLVPDQDEMMLCDCPGLVFPSFVSNTADLIAAGVFPISQMRDHWPVMNLICQRIPREIINALYGIQLPVPTEQQLRERGLTEMPPPTGQEFLDTFCVARSMLAASSGVPDHARAARIVIKDYTEGKLLYCHAPPSVQGDATVAFYRETIVTALLNTRKLREKISRQEQQQQQALVSENSAENSTLELNEQDLLVDEDLLDLVGGDISSHTSSNSSKRSSTRKKWGKKGRKVRNKDPYGCHSTVDEQMLSSQSTGVIVNAGKYGRKGYTRPASYGGVRAAPN